MGRDLTFIYSLNVISFTACTRLPETWIRVKTETEFLVNTGTTITVSCQEGYINTGSKIVTCNTYVYQDFQYDTEPTCTRTVGKYPTVQFVSRITGVNLQIPKNPAPVQAMS